MDGQQPALQRAKPKNRFTLCCFCLGGSSSDPDLSGATFDYSDRCDYVVEKLTIKKVPIALFATEEDLAEMRHSALLERCQEPVATTIYDTNVLPKESILSSYYAMINNRSSNETQNTDQLNKTSPRSKLARDMFTNTLAHVQKNASVDAFVQKTTEGTNTINTFQDVTDMATRKEQGDHKLQPLHMQVSTLKPILKQKEIVKADVHKTFEELNNRYSLSPELQQTLEVLGSKRPDTSQTIKQRMGVRTVRTSNRPALPNDEVNKAKHVTIVEKDEESKQVNQVLPETGICGPSALSFPINLMESGDLVKGESSLVSNESRAFVENDGILVEHDAQTRLTCKQLEAMINGDTSGNYANPKWKIIIKEHGKNASSTASSRTTTSDSDSDEESDYEESTTE